MTLGNQTVTFVTLVGTGVYDEYGLETMAETEVPVEGCLHQPMSASEAPEWLTNIGTQPWITTAPPEAAAVAAKSTGKLKEGGVTYEIIGGAQPNPDFSGAIHNVTILSKIEAP